MNIFSSLANSFSGDSALAAVRKPVGPPPLALRLAAVLAVPLLLYALLATGQKAVENYRLNQQADELRAQVVSLRDQNIQLQQQLVQARTDEAIETIARERLGLVKPGDSPVVLLPPETSKDAGARPSSAPVAPPPPWQQWWNFFFGG
jgi:cell division protein FtsB